MPYLCQRAVSRLSASVMCLSLMSLLSAWLTGTCLAQPALPEIPKNAEWISGPAVTPLADLAEIKIPEGFRFTDRAGAKTLLEKMRNPVPKGLIGIVAPNSGGWWVILEFSDVGYVSEDGAAKMDPETILAAMQERLQTQNDDRARAGLPPVDKLEWQVQPTYDPQTKTLEWAVKAYAGSDAVLNHTVRLLSRNGVLDAIAVRPVQANLDLTDVKKLMADVRFKSGQQYADYKAGDKVAAKTMGDLLVDDSEDPKIASSDWKKSFWVALGAVLLLVCFVAAGGTVLVKKLRSRPAPVATEAPTPAVQTAQTSQTPPAAPVSAQRPVLIKSKPANFKSKPAVNGNAAAARRRGFDYNRYFTDLMSNVYSGSYGVDTTPVNGVAEEVNGHSYGIGLPANGKAPAVNGFSSDELFTNQKSLIEEQRRLIQEQSKLIEEKSRLIEEKNKILRLQSELMDRKLV